MQRLLVVLSCASTQYLIILDSDAEKWTNLLRVSSLGWGSISSGAAAHRDAVITHDTYVADGVDDFCLRIALPVLTRCADLGICASWNVAELRCALGAVTAVDTRGAVELTVGQRIRWTSFRVDALA